MLTQSRTFFFSNTIAGRTARGRIVVIEWHHYISLYCREIKTRITHASFTLQNYIKLSMKRSLVYLFGCNCLTTSATVDLSWWIDPKYYNRACSFSRILSSHLCCLMKCGYLTRQRSNSFLFPARLIDMLPLFFLLTLFWSYTIWVTAPTWNVTHRWPLQN